MIKSGLRYAGRVFALSAVFCLCLLCGCIPGESQGLAEDKPDIKVTFFDVGKGDAILIETASHCMMIDAGYDDTAGSILSYMKEGKIEHLDYLLITHFDKDHVGGADRILQKIETETVLQPDYQSDSGQYREYQEALKAEGLSPVAVRETMELSFDGAEFVIYPPQKEDYKEEDNDFSLVVRMQYGEESFLFAGDSERERIRELLSQQEFALEADVLKVPHHGRKEKNSEEFLRAVNPRIAVITSSREKPADEEVCSILEELGTDIYFTENGRVTILWDGTELRTDQKR